MPKINCVTIVDKQQAMELYRFINIVTDWYYFTGTFIIKIMLNTHYFFIFNILDTIFGSVSLSTLWN